MGRTVGDVGDDLRLPRSDAKSYAAQVVRRAFGATGSRIKEFDELGLTLRITRVGPNLMPYEALSFPAFSYQGLLDELWEDSDLLSRVEYMLIVPVIGSDKATRQSECELGLPVFWRPSRQQLESIRIEWEMFRLEIRTGHAKNLTPASETTMIHVRPHGRNGFDTDDAPIVGPVVKKSFWLNRESWWISLAQLLETRGRGATMAGRFSRRGGMPQHALNKPVSKSILQRPKRGRLTP